MQNMILIAPMRAQRPDARGDGVWNDSPATASPRARHRLEEMVVCARF